MTDSKPNLQLKAAPIAPLYNGSVYQTGQNNTANATKQQMELIGASGGKKRTSRSSRKRRTSSRRKRRRRRGSSIHKKRRGGDSSTIKPQTFPPTYPVPAGSVTPNQNSAAITKLFADSAANAEFDGKVGEKSGGKRNKRSGKCKSCLKRQHGRKSRKKRGGVKWGCMS